MGGQVYNGGLRSEIGQRCLWGCLELGSGWIQQIPGLCPAVRGPHQPFSATLKATGMQLRDIGMGSAVIETHLIGSGTADKCFSPRDAE